MRSRSSSSAKLACRPQTGPEVPAAQDRGAVLFAYDGSDQAKAAIREAARQLEPGRPAVVLAVWQPLAALPFVGPARVPPDLEAGFEKDAGDVAREGAELARSVGFDASPRTERGEPIWRGIVDAADAHDAGIVVLGSHGRRASAWCCWAASRPPWRGTPTARR
jgi:nucleotide-binding universal stress UspA family protein